MAPSPAPSSVCAPFGGHRAGDWGEAEAASEEVKPPAANICGLLLSAHRLVSLKSAMG